MDKETITRLIKTTPSPVVKLVMEGNSQPLFIIMGIIEEINNESLIFKSRTQTSAIDFRKILEITLTDRRQL
jgi:hypothetical protein